MRSACLRALVAPFAFAALATLAGPLAADEGMWTLDNLPLQRLQQRYGFRPAPGWVEHLQKASVSFGGGSGAFVSADGLVLTNHHVARGQLQKLSSREHDYMREGFFARGAAEEAKCPDLELRVLVSTENVTERVKKAVDAKATESQQSAQRRAVFAALEKESREKTGLQSRVVDLYHGGEFWIYRYKKYTDVRLVMAPERRIAFFGGDWDNFCYPRHDLDFAFFRIYENGAPVHPQRWFRWNPAGPNDQDLVFVSGNPGQTARQLTVSQLEYQRDGFLPIRIAQGAHRLEALRRFSAKGPEQARRAADRIAGLSNNYKRQKAFLEVLKDPAVMEKKRREEESLKARAAKNPKAAAECEGAWDRIAAAQQELMRRSAERDWSELGTSARLVAIANDIVRYVAEVEKPNGERLPAYRESNLESLRFQLFSPAPIYPDVDAVTLASQLEDARTMLGPENAFVRASLGGRTPALVADELMQRTRLADVAYRRHLIDGGRKAVEASTDPLILWARKLDPSWRELRKWFEDKVENVETREGGRIARARFELDGRSIYPDATGSLRLSYGKVAGYEELTTRVPWRTTFYGLYDRAASFGNDADFELPAKVADARARVEMSTPLDFALTTDIIGGNSGSPVLNRELELVGLIFDGNTQAFRWNYDYDDEQARAVAVHSGAILEALRKIYDMPALADELTKGGGRDLRAGRAGATQRGGP